MPWGVVVIIVIDSTVNIRNPDRGRISDSILYQYRASENLTFLSGFGMVSSPDRFKKKRVMNKILFMPKRSRLAEIFGPV
jgi:hypothetical protein